LQAEWNSISQDTPFDYFFLDQHFDAFYREDRQFAGVFGFFAIIGVVITCMGLFGLSCYNTGIKTKEVGIRKCLGGSTSSIMWLFCREYIVMVATATLVGIPIGGLMLLNWLKDYPNKISFHADLILMPVILIAGFTFFTVSYQTFKAARMNPVKSLKSE